MASHERTKPAVGWEVLQSDPTILQPGDIVHMRWPGFPWCLVRRATRAPGEPPTWANHTAIIVAHYPAPLLIEAMVQAVIRQPNRYQRPPWWTLWRGHFGLVIHRRPGGLSPGIKQGIAAKAMDYQGRAFGVGKLILHALDHWIGDRYVFRRLARMDDYPICSWIVAYSYYRLIGLRFNGQPPNAASPDDIMDHCVDNGWELVWVDSGKTLKSYRHIYFPDQP